MGHASNSDWGMSNHCSDLLLNFSVLLPLSTLLCFQGKVLKGRGVFFSQGQSEMFYFSNCLIVTAAAAHLQIFMFEPLQSIERNSILAYSLKFINSIGGTFECSHC